MQDYKSLCAAVMTCATLADPKLHINTLTPVTLEKYVKPKVNLH